MITKSKKIDNNFGAAANEGKCKLKDIIKLLNDIRMNIKKI